MRPLLFLLGLAVLCAPAPATACEPPEETAMARNPGRPAREFMRRCTRELGSSAPGAVCAATWQRMSAAAQRQWERNPYGYPVGTNVRLQMVDPHNATGLGRGMRPLPGVWTVIGGSAGRLHVRHPGTGTMLNVPADKVRLANPSATPRLSPELERAARDYIDFHWGREPRMARVRIPQPKPPFIELGPMPAVPYGPTVKGHQRDTWEHEFEGRRKPLLVRDARGDLYILRNGSRYRVRPEGIVG